MEINNSKLRIGNFTSSQIHRLCKSLKNGNPTASFYSYCEEVMVERQIKRSSKTNIKTRPMKWGKLMEVVLFNILGLEYTMEHINTKVHPEYSFWSGTPDLIAPNVKTGEIKCFEPLHFVKLSNALLSKNTEVIKENEPEAYWQAVSNSLICGFDRTEIIAYMPYFSELELIIDKIESSDFLTDNNLDDKDYYFISRDEIDTLPYLPDDSPYSNINSFEFEIPESDKWFLIERVKMAEKEVEDKLNSMFL